MGFVRGYRRALLGPGGRLRLMVPQYAFGDFLDLAVGEIWRYGADAAQVPGRLAAMLAGTAGLMSPASINVAGRRGGERWWNIIDQCAGVAPVRKRAAR